MKFEVDTAFSSMFDTEGNSTTSYVFGADKNYYTGYNIAVDWKAVIYGNVLQGIRGTYGGNQHDTMFFSRVYPILEKMYKIKLEKNTIDINNGENIVTNNNWDNEEVSWSIALFGTNRNSNISIIRNLRIYKFIVSLNNRRIQELIPCYSTENVTDINGKTCPSGTIGMYDIVEGKFYTNQGTGTFIKGNDV